MKLPWYARLIVVIFCFPTILGACAMAPQMPPAVPLFTYSGAAGSAVFFDTPCTEPKVMALVPQEMHSLMKSARGSYEGKEYGLCWLYKLDDSGDIVLVWEDGGIGGLTKRILKPGTAV